MKVSVIIPGRNENGEIEQTYNSFVENGCEEIIIYDDGSDVELPQFPLADNIRHSVPLGPSVCRNLGGRKATGDVLIFSDAHVRVENIRELCQFVLDEGVVGIPRMLSLYNNEPVYGYCRDFVLSGKSNELFTLNTSNKKPEVDRYAYCYGNWGGLFVMSKNTFNKIDGWVDHKYWGYNDPSLIAKCFFCNIDTVLDMNLTYKHKGKVKSGFGYPVTAKQPLLNLFHSYYVIFDQSTFEGYWLPLLKKEHKHMYEEGLEYISSESIKEEAKRFKQLKKRSDDEFFNEFLKQDKNRTEYTPKIN